LIVLDNCEHVIGAAADLVDAALASPGAWRLLATSREPLGLVGEHVVPVEPLGEMAAQLFAERAARLEPRIAWDADDPRIVALCARLDGLPLAVELAAGQVRRWSLDEIVRRLHGPEQQLPARATRSTPRHRTLSAAIDWSYALLDDDEQRLLRHLGVFPSSFRLEAAEALAPLFPGVEIGDVLASLVDKSLVVRELQSDSYRLLESIRADALERLSNAGEREAAFEWHRQWIVGVARSSSRMDRWNSARLAARQHRDAEHVRQAFWASLDAGQLDDAAELAIGRSFEWRNAAGCVEGHRWVDALAGRSLDPLTAAWVAVLRADIALGDGDFFPMVAAAQEAAALASGRDPVAYALAQCFLMLQHLLDPRAADTAIESVLAISPDQRLTSLLEVFVFVAHAGRTSPTDLERQVAALDARCTDDGYERFMLNWAMWLHGLALLDAEWAQRGIGQQYEYLRATGMAETWLTAYSLAVTHMIDGESGRGQLASARAIAEREGYRIDGDCVIALAYSEACAGQPVVAAELLGLARTCRFNATANHVLQRVVVGPVVRAAIEPDVHRAAIDRGKQRSLEATLAEYGIT
jgi:predicted ATPase